MTPSSAHLGELIPFVAETSTLEVLPHFVTIHTVEAKQIGDVHQVLPGPFGGVTPPITAMRKRSFVRNPSTTSSSRAKSTACDCGMLRARQERSSAYEEMPIRSDRPYVAWPLRYLIRGPLKSPSTTCAMRCVTSPFSFETNSSTAPRN